MKNLWLSSAQRKFLKLTLESLRRDPGEWKPESSSGSGWLINKTLKVSVWHQSDLYKVEVVHNGKTILQEASSELIAQFHPWRIKIKNACRDAIASKKFLALYNALSDTVGHKGGYAKHKTPKLLISQCGEALCESIKKNPGDWYFVSDTMLINAEIEVSIWMWKHPAGIHVDFDGKRIINYDFNLGLPMVFYPSQQWRRKLMIITAEGSETRTKIGRKDSLESWEYMKFIKEIKKVASQQ